MATKYAYLGSISVDQLWTWLLSDQSPNLPGEDRKLKSQFGAKRPSKKRAEELMRQQAAIRRFRLTAKSRRAKVVVAGPNPLAGITLKGAGKKKDAGTKRTAGVFVSRATKQFTGKGTERIWMPTRTCGYCHERGLWSKGSLGQCQHCKHFTDLQG